jgi:DNA repair exonuclease SbcCD ATPase subunit
MEENSSFTTESILEMEDKLKQVEIICSSLDKLNNSKYMFVHEILKRNKELLDYLSEFQVKIQDENYKNSDAFQNDIKSPEYINRYVDSLHELNNNLNQVNFYLFTIY